MILSGSCSSKWNVCGNDLLAVHLLGPKPFHSSCGPEAVICQFWSFCLFNSAETKLAVIIVVYTQKPFKCYQSIYVDCSVQTFCMKCQPLPYLSLKIFFKVNIF